MTALGLGIGGEMMPAIGVRAGLAGGDRLVFHQRVTTLLPRVVELAFNPDNNGSPDESRGAGGRLQTPIHPPLV